MAGQEYFGIRIDTEKLEQDAQQAKKAFDGIADEAVKAGETMDNALGNGAQMAAGKFNMLNVSIQQIARELPSLAISPGTFFLAISNNLPMLTDALAQAREENNRLVDAGEKAIPVFKQVGKALFSWQTALSLLPALLVLFGDDILGFFEKMLSGSKKVDMAAESLKAFRDTMLKGTQNAQKEITDIRLLYNATQDITKAVDERRKAVDELQRQYPDYFGNLSDEEILAGKAADAYDRLTNSIIANAKAQAARQRITEEQTKVVDYGLKIEEAYAKLEPLEKKLQEAEKRLSTAQTAASIGAAGITTSGAKAIATNGNVAVQNAKSVRDELQSQVNDIYDEIEEYRAVIRQADNLSRKLEESINVSDLIVNSDKQGTEKKQSIDNLKQYLNELLGLQEDNEERQIELTKTGTEKQLALIEFRYKRQIEAVKKLQEELKKAQGGTLTGEQQGVFDTAFSGLSQAKENEKLSVLKKQEEEQKKLFERERADMQEYLIEYGNYWEKRKAIVEKYTDLIAKAETEGERLSLGKEREKLLKELEDSLFDNSDLWVKMFSKASEMSNKTIKYVIKDINQLLNYLSGISKTKPTGFTDEQLDSLKNNSEAIKDIYDALIEKQDELDRRTNYPFDSIVKGFQRIKSSSELAKKALSEVDEEKKNVLQEQSEREYGKGVSYLKDGAIEASDAVGFLAEKMEILAEATGDAKFKEFSDQFSAFSQNLQAAGQGAQSGGWIGAIVGGASNMINQTVASMAQLQVEANEYEQNRIDFLRELEQLSLSLKNEDYDSIFGTSSIEKARDAYMLAQEALQKYNEELKKTSQVEIEEEFKNLGAAIFAPIFGSFGFGKKISEETKALMAAYEKGYTDLQAMAVKTKDRSGWANFWGKKDEYTALKDLAPELWNEDGTFNVEAAQAFLDTNTQISDEQRKQIQNVIDLKNAYDENIAIIDELLASTFGSLGSDITDIIFDSVRNGTDAWEQFREVGSEVIDELGKQMVQELYVQTYLDTFKERMRAAYGLDSVEDTQKELANIMADIYKGLESVLDGASLAAEEWDKWAEEQGFTLGGEAEPSVQTATSKGFATMSQDSADELNGRFTALYESNLRIESQISIGNVNLEAAKNAAEQMRDITQNCYIELVEIRENTGAVVKPIQQMQKDMEEMKNTIKERL